MKRRKNSSSKFGLWWFYLAFSSSSSLFVSTQEHNVNNLFAAPTAWSSTLASNNFNETSEVEEEPAPASVFLNCSSHERAEGEGKLYVPKLLTLSREDKYGQYLINLRCQRQDLNTSEPVSNDYIDMKITFNATLPDITEDPDSHVKYVSMSCGSNKPSSLCFNPNITERDLLTGFVCVRQEFCRDSAIEVRMGEDPEEEKDDELESIAEIEILKNVSALEDGESDPLSLEEQIFQKKKIYTTSHFVLGGIISVLAVLLIISVLRRHHYNTKHQSCAFNRAEGENGHQIEGLDPDEVKALMPNGVRLKNEAIGVVHDDGNSMMMSTNGRQPEIMVTRASVINESSTDFDESANADSIRAAAV